MKQTTISLIVSICIYQVPILFRIYDYILNGELSFCVVFSFKEKLYFGVIWRD